MGFRSDPADFLMTVGLEVRVSGFAAIPHPEEQNKADSSEGWAREEPHSTGGVQDRDQFSVAVYFSVHRSKMLPAKRLQ